jgi:AraC-like DNA-binding protein
MTAMGHYRLYIWSHRILYLGLSPDNDLHQHHAAQLCVSLDRPLRYRMDSGSPWLTGRAILVPPDHQHQINAGDARILALFLEPESDDFPVAYSTGAVRTLSLSNEGAHTIRSLFDRGVDAGAAWAICMSAFNLSPDERSESTRGDKRVQSVVELIRSHPDHSFSARELAQTIHLSPSRLSQVFKSQVGVPIRRFIVWSRLRTVINHALQGASLTEAAHAAGFSDAAHMSNAFRQMFGFAPSALFAKDVPKEVIIVE